LKPYFEVDPSTFEVVRLSDTQIKIDWAPITLPFEGATFTYEIYVQVWTGEFDVSWCGGSYTADLYYEPSENTLTRTDSRFADAKCIRIFYIRAYSVECSTWGDTV